ncbi:MAG: hypothetical protein KGJ09_02775 [Candidatus Omnitrophica bacterium]|nr:hypothetical protein [Candidatus Omnitrophota bacterium]
MTFSSIRRSWYSRYISLCLMAAFIGTMVITPKAYAQEGVLGLPQPGAMVDLSPAYVPLMITGLTVHPHNPLLMDFIVNTGNSGLDAAQVKKESGRLIKYFLACLTIPENDQWVNLSPYEKDRIIPKDLGQTVLGRDMLAQDYILKQLTASMIYPEKNLGRKFWNDVYAKARQMYGTTQIPVNTFNKVWILPEFAQVYEHGNTVLVVKSHLKVMLDQDYLALKHHAQGVSSTAEESKVDTLGSQIVRQVILPAIEHEVNTGRNFAQMRQIYNSMILAVWFKENLKQALLNQVYTDRSKVNGVNVADPAIKEKIYRQYLEAYKKGVFNYIKEETDPNSQETIPRKYFSGGLTPFDAAMLHKVPAEEAEADLSGQPGRTFDLLSEVGKVPGNAAHPNAAMTVSLNRGLTEALNQLGVSNQLNAVQGIMVDAVNVEGFLGNLDKLYEGKKSPEAIKTALTNVGILSRDGTSITTEIFDQNNAVTMFKSRLGVKEVYVLSIQKAMVDAMDVPQFLKSFPDEQQSTVAEALVNNGGDNGIFEAFKPFVSTPQTSNAAMTSTIESAWRRADEMGLKGAILLEFEEEHPRGGGDINLFVPAVLAPLHQVKGKLLSGFPHGSGKDVYIDGTPGFSPDNIIMIKWKDLVYLAPHLKPQGLSAILSFFQAQHQGLPQANDLIEIVRTDAAMAGQPSRQLENILSEKVTSVKESMQPLLEAYDAAKAQGQADKVKGIEGEINQIVDKVNVYDQSNPEDLVLSDDVQSLAGFLSSPDVRVYQNEARQDLLTGDYVPQFIFAGAATRLNRGPMYNLDIWDIAVEMGKAKPGDAKSHMGMGPRQIMAYRLALESLAQKNGLPVQEVLARQKMIVNVNADVEQIVLDDFLKNDFYGFDPDNVYFITQPTFHGYKFENGRLVFDPKSPTVPYGHGYNFMQLGQPGQAYTLGLDGSRRYLKGSVLSQFPDDALIGSHRINDLTKLSEDSVVSVDKLAFAIAKFEQGFDVVGELVDNPNKQKGGNVLKNRKTGKSFLIETSNVKGNPALIKLLDEAGKVGAPYNAFRLVYKVGGLKKILQENLPFNLRFKDGEFYLEAVTGDVTQMPDTNAVFMNSGEQIHDFKEPKNMDDALYYLRKSDDQIASANPAMVTDESILSWRSPHGLSLSQVLDKIIKEYDIRGFDGYGDQTQYPQQMDATLLRWIGRALGMVKFYSAAHDREVQLKPGDTFVIGGDNGPSTEELVKKNLIKGLRDVGINVIDLGVTNSGHTYKSIKEFGAQGGLYVTRSHVEVGTNGAKPIIDGITLYGEMLTAIKGQILKAEYRKAQRGELMTEHEPEAASLRARAKQAYLDSLKRDYRGLADQLSQMGLRVAVNLNSGSMAADADYRQVIRDILGAGNIETFLKEEPDALATKGLADPSRADEKALAHKEANIVAYSENHPDVPVFNFDLDADRVSILWNGRLFLGDEIFYPIIEYQSTLAPYADILRNEAGFAFDSRMKSEVFELAKHFGVKAGLHPKGHSKVKATMDVILRQIASQRGMTVAKFLKTHPGFRMAEPEYSLHMFLSNSRGESLDDALDFMFFWLNAWGKVTEAKGDSQLTLAQYIQNLKDKGIINDAKQVPEQRIPINEDAKFDSMTKMKNAVIDFFAGRDDFEYISDYRDSSKRSKSYALVNNDGVFHLYTPYGEAFWGWSNTSPKVAIGVQSATEESKKRLAQIVTAMYIHARNRVAEDLHISLPQIDPLETKALYQLMGASSPGELEGKILEKYPTMEAALSAIPDAAMAASSAVIGEETDWLRAINSSGSNEQLKGITKQLSRSGLPEREIEKLIQAANFRRKLIFKNEKNKYGLGRSQAEPGGIDLNSRTLNMESTGQKVHITFDPAMIAQFRRGDFSGVKIQILNVVPIQLAPLLGLKQ